MSDPGTTPNPHDYSLPGVMKYLQNEWQKNERDRIQWDLERSEMKTRIARLEGEKKSLEMIIESQVKKLSILESSIRNMPISTEVANTANTIESHEENVEQKTGSENKEGVDREKEGQDKVRKELYERSKELLDRELNDIQSIVDLSPIVESRDYLEKCIQEVDYLLQTAHMGTTTQ